MERVVIDTNVLVSALISTQGPPAQIIDLVETKMIKLVLSKNILHEYKIVLARKKFQTLQPNRVQKLLKGLETLAVLVKPEEIPIITSDPEDNKFVATAVAGKAKFLITGNLKHFPKTYLGIHVLLPRHFLDQIVPAIFLKLG
jgi:uncharacterized protein